MGNAGTMQWTGAGLIPWVSMAHSNRLSPWEPVCTKKVVLKLEHVSASPGVLVKAQVTGSHPRISDAVGQELVFVFFIKFPGDADAARLGTTFGEPLTKKNVPWGKLGRAVASWCLLGTLHAWEVRLGPT